MLLIISLTEIKLLHSLGVPSFFFQPHALKQREGTTRDRVLFLSINTYHRFTVMAGMFTEMEEDTLADHFDTI